MKKSLLPLFAAALLLAAPRVNAEPRNITTISAEQVSEIEAMHQQATDLLIKNDFQGALRAYSDIVLAEPDDETAYTGLGQIYMVLGQLKKAHEAFQNALEINPNNQVALQGIQQIMDPDGVEGMTNRDQAERELGTQPPAEWQEPPALDPGFKAAASVEKRTGPISRVYKKLKPAKKRAPKGFRLGLLNAQRIQMSLRNAGVYAGPVNGMIGDRTQQAIRNFQKIRGLNETGTVNVATWLALSPYLEL